MPLRRLLHLGFCLVLPSVLSQCPSGFVEVESWCYSFKGLGLGVAGANTHCASLAEGGKLVDIETETEFNALVDWMTASKLLFSTI